MAGSMLTFPTAAAAVAAVYSSWDATKIVRILSPLSYYLIVSVTGGVATFTRIDGMDAGTVTNAMLASMAAHTFKGNNTGSSGAPLDLTATQLTAELNNFVGDSGSGGTKGLVPAPAAGDAAAAKFLKADGTWATAGSGTGITGSPPLWMHPASAGGIDDEFEATSISGWTFRDNTSGATRTPTGAIDMFTALTGATAVPRFSSHTNGRNSWLSLQVTDSGNENQFHKGWTPTSNDCVWTRMGVRRSLNSAASFVLTLNVGQTSGGNPDNNNRFLLGLNLSSPDPQLTFQTVIGGASTVTNVGVNKFNFWPEFFGIQKVSTSYYFWLFGDAGHHLCLNPGSGASGITPDRVWFRITSSETTKPFLIFDFDFIRQTGGGLPF